VVVALVTFRVTETLTILRQAGTDRDGDPVGTPAETDVPGCVTWPAGGGTELQGQQDTVISDRIALFPPGTDVKSTDQVRRGDDRYNVTTRPEAWGPSPFTGTAVGVQVQLTRVTG
jgi:hypothetical protein